MGKPGDAMELLSVVVFVQSNNNGESNIVLKILGNLSLQELAFLLHEAQHIVHIFQ